MSSMGDNLRLLTEQEEIIKAAENSFYRRKPFIMSTALSSGQAKRAESSDPDEQSLYKQCLQQFGVSGAEDMLVFAINPSEMSIALRLRGAYDYANGATVYHSWDGVVGIGGRFDVMEVSLTFQSGSILPHWKSELTKRENWYDAWKNFFNNVNNSQSQSFADWKYTSGKNAGSFVMPFGVEMHQKFLALLNQPRTLPDGSLNEVTLETTSRMFPSMVLSGFFDLEAIGETTMSADDPNQFTWTTTFVATKTTPSLASSDQLRAQFRAAMVELIQYGGIVGKLIPTEMAGETVSNYKDALLAMLGGEASYTAQTDLWKDLRFSTGGGRSNQ